MVTDSCSFQAPSQSMKLKDLKVAVEEHSNAVFSSFSCRREALLFLKKKVCIITSVTLSADGKESVVFLPVFFKMYLRMYLLWSMGSLLSYMHHHLSNFECICFLICSRNSHLPIVCILRMRHCIQLAYLCVDFGFISLCSAASRKQEIQSGRQESSSRVMNAKQIWILSVVVHITLLVSSPHICCCSRFLTDVGAHWACSISGPVRFAEKTSRNTVSADLLWEKNTVPAEKEAEKYEL